MTLEGCNRRSVTPLLYFLIYYMRLIGEVQLLLLLLVLFYLYKYNEFPLKKR